MSTDPHPHPFDAYLGPKPFVFISYAHKDRALVYPLITKMNQDGLRIWYDEGIPPSTKWTKTIADKILSCAIFLVFLSPIAVESENVLDEINLAKDCWKDKQIQFFIIFLTKTVLPGELRLTIGRIQALMLYEISESAIFRKLYQIFRPEVFIKKDGPKEQVQEKSRKLENLDPPAFDIGQSEEFGKNLFSAHSFYLDLGKNAFSRLQFEEALGQFQKALSIATENLIEIETIEEIQTLITRSDQALKTQKADQAIKRQKAEEELKRQKAEEEMKRQKADEELIRQKEAEDRRHTLQMYVSLINQTRQAIQHNKLNSATSLLQKAHVLAQQHQIDTSEEGELANQIQTQIKQIDDDARQFLSAGRFPDALMRFQLLLQKSIELGWEKWKQYATDQISQLKMQISDGTKQFEFLITNTKNLQQTGQYQAAKDAWQQVITFAQQFNFTEHLAEARTQLALCENQLRTKDYHGTPLIIMQHAILHIIEQMIGMTIPVNQSLSSNFGVQIQNAQVVRLGLIHANLTHLPDNIGNLQSLTYLNVSSNKLASLPESIGNLQFLSCLNLTSNCLTSLPEKIGNLITLTDLQLQRNLLTTLPKTFGDMKSLRTLSLEENRLTVLPANFSNLSKLKILSLNNNKLIDLPKNFGILSALTYLNLEHNSLTSLPESFWNLKSLDSLILDQNRLISLPDDIGNLKFLTKLSIQKNGLSSVPSSLGNLKSLTILELQNNNLSELPESIVNLTSLITLDLQDNQFAQVQVKIGNIRFLSSLNSDTNKSTSLSENTKKVFKILEEHGCRILR